MNIKSTPNTRLRTKLQRISTIISGVYARSTPVGSIAYLQIKDLMTSSIGTAATRVEPPQKITSYLLRKGDLLFAGKGTTHLCKVFDSDIQAIPSTTLFAIRPHLDIITPEYLCWYLNHPNVIATIKTTQVGTGTPMIHKSTLENLEIIIPSKEIQNHIVALANLQQREDKIIKEIAKKKMQITNQILLNILNK